MTSREDHLCGILEIGRPLGVKAAFICRQATEASCGFKSSHDPRLEEIPRHPSAGEYEGLSRGLLGALASYLSEVVVAC